MLISEKMNEQLNNQIMHEQHAAHTYLDLSCAWADMGLNIIAAWFRHHADEERQHAMKIFHYIHEVGGRVKLQGIATPADRPTTPEALVQTALDHEMTVTGQINDLMALADSEKDYATRGFLQWFVDEQIEELSVINELLTLLKLTEGKNLLQVESRVAKMMARDAN